MPVPVQYRHSVFSKPIVIVTVCYVLDSARFSVGEISHLSKISSMPLCKACPGCGGMVKVSCSCGHMFITKRSKPRFNNSKE